MEVVPFLSQKNKRLLKAMDELSEYAFKHGRAWTGLDTSRVLTPEERAQVVISTATLLRLVADRLQKEFIAIRCGSSEVQQGE